MYEKQHKLLLLVSGATKTLRSLPDDDPVGHLVIPNHYSNYGVLLQSGRPYAADNGCFGGLNEPLYLRMLSKLQDHKDKLLWVTIPDVVGDCNTTRLLWEDWYPRVHSLGMRCAYVLQDGEEDPPWDQLDCVFVGGSTEWKLSGDVRALCVEAKARGKWVHVGRVNSQKRTRLFYGLADSIDGSSYSKWTPKLLKWLHFVKEVLPNET